MCHALDNGDVMPKCKYILFAYITVSIDVRLYKLIFFALYNTRWIWWYLGYFIIMSVELVCMFVWLLSHILASTRQFDKILTYLHQYLQMKRLEIRL